MRVLFSDEKFFDVGGFKNAQNQIIWAVSRVEADEGGAVQMRQKFLKKSHGLTRRLFQSSDTFDPLLSRDSGPCLIYS
jgi:hypothetical protein